MSAIQHHAETFNPNALNMVQLATYDRLILAPLVRVWENVLDWEHLPYLHDTSFNYVELDTGGQWGWRTWSNADHTGHVELTVASANSYVARSYQAGHQVSEIWTTLTGAGDSTQVQVRFFMPDIAENKIEKLGQVMTNLYTQLWDEDEAMMQQRQKRLHEHRDNRRERNLGKEANIRSKLACGDAVTFQVKRREYQIAEIEGRLVAIPTICPHLMGPLLAVDTHAGVVRCPWHGYQFDIKSGECIFPEHADCKLPAAPELILGNGNIIARMS
ncbi:MAG: Rieske 2Fe-2S domain-containing protein [Gammaproteobacteria bacterium]|nr:Rieske 2Fe-2S domain-containing protein [Gammaproteobacteria bacterium]